MKTNWGLTARARWLLVAVATALLGAALTAPAAPAAWTAPTNLNAGQAYNPQLAMTADGDTVFVWELGSEQSVQTRRITAGVLGAVSDVDSSLAASPQVGVDADGNAVFTYHDFSSGTNVAARTQLSSGAFLGVARTIATATTTEKPQGAVDPDGNSVFAWVGDSLDSSRVQARRLGAGNGVLSATRFLSAAGEDALSPQVAIDDDSNSIFTWTRFDGTNWRIQARRLTAGNALGPVIDISVAGQDALDPQIGVDYDGDAVITWNRFDGTNFRVQGRQLSSTGVLGPVLPLSKAGRNANSPQVAVNPAGTALFTWREFDGASWRIKRARMTSAGVLGTAANVSGAGESAAQPQVALNPAGLGIIVFRRFDGTKQRVEARTVSASGALSPVDTLSTAGVNAVTPQVAIDPAGATAAVWRAGTLIQEATGP